MPSMPSVLTSLSTRGPTAAVTCSITNGGPSASTKRSGRALARAADPEAIERVPLALVANRCLAPSSNLAACHRRPSGPRCTGVGTFGDDDACRMMDALT